jgi:alpha-methylacyl-CoA racemase
MEGTDVCYAPVLRMSEAAEHPHNVARKTFIDVAGVTQPAPAPRYSRSSTSTPTPPAHAGQHTRAVLADWGIDAARIETLIASGAAKQA